MVIMVCMVNVQKFEYYLASTRSRQIVQSHIRLLQKQSDQGLPVCYPDMHFGNSNPYNQHFI